MRNKILLTAFLIALPVFLTGCTLQDIPVIGSLFGPNAGNSNKPVTLNVWGLWESPDVMNALISKYKETHPNVSVSYDDRSVMGASQYKETLVGRIGQADVADVVLVHNSWVPSIEGSLEPAPSSVLTPDQFNSKFYSVAAQSAVANGKVYAVPMYFDGLVMVYNKKHFEEVGQAAPPTSWEEFRRLAFSLTKKDADGKLIRAGAAIGAADNIGFFSDILGTFFVQAGINVPADLDSTAARDALAYYTLFSKSDKDWDNSFPEASAAFAQERVSMIFVPSWNLLDIVKARPDLSIGVAPIPQATTDSPTTWGSFWMYAVPSASPNKAAAWDFINYLTSDEAQLLQFTTAAQTRTYGAPFSLISLKEQITSGPYSSYLKPLMDTASYAKSSMFAARAGNDTYVNGLKEAVNSVLASGGDIKSASADALKTLKQKVSATK